MEDKKRNVSKGEISRFDKLGFVRSRGVETRIVDNEINLCCPFCSDHRFRFFLNSGNGKSICHNCGWSSRYLPDLISRWAGISFKAAEDLVSGAKGRRRTAVSEKEAEHVHIDYPEGHRYLTIPPRQGQKLFWRYLERRNISASTALDFRLGYTCQGYYAWRVIIPVFWNGDLVSWVGRDITGSVPKSRKALTPHGNHQSEYLFNLDRLWGRDTVVLCEGPFDVIRIHDMAVGSFGKRLHDEQVKLLRRARVRRVIVAHDPDAWQPELADGKRPRPPMILDTFQKLLPAFDEVRVVIFPDDRDPADLPETTMRSLVASSERVTRAHIQRLTREATNGTLRAVSVS